MNELIKKCDNKYVNTYINIKTHTNTYINKQINIYINSWKLNKLKQHNIVIHKSNLILLRLPKNTKK